MRETTKEDDSFSDVLLSAEEYSGLKKLVQEAEYREDKALNRLNYVRQNFERELNEQKKKADADTRAQVAREQAIVSEQENIIAKLREELSQAKAEVENVSGLNKNLIRIMTERANQARGIHPKKQHEGYVVLECRQWTEKYVEEVWDSPIHKKQYDSVDYRAFAKKKRYLVLEHKAANVWKSRIQTPFDASIPLEYFSKEAMGSLDSLVRALGVTHFSSMLGKYKGFEDGSLEEKRNTMYRIRCNANYREGFWEVEIFTTRALVVPEGLRLPRRAGKNGGASA